jgi:4a-hydroxytetrahydrobiopterin dehydratase
MTDLHQMKCVGWPGGEPTLTKDQIAGLMPRVPGRRVDVIEGVKRLERVYKFPSFANAVAFAKRVADIAEAGEHHPLIMTEWGKVTVRWWTHKIKGLHRNEFTMATKTDRVLSP